MKELFKEVAAIMIFTKDTRKSTGWYSDLLGVKPKIINEEQGLIEIGQVNLLFHLADEKSLVSTGGSVSYWKVNDFDGVIKKAINAGAKIWRGPKDISELGVRIAQIKDPFGSVFGIEERLSNKKM